MNKPVTLNKAGLLEALQWVSDNASKMRIDNPESASGASGFHYVHLQTIRTYLNNTRSHHRADGWQPVETMPRDIVIHTHGYLLRYGDPEHRSDSPITNYEDYISANTVYPLTRTDYNNDGDTYVRTHWMHVAAPPAAQQKDEVNE